MLCRKGLPTALPVRHVSALNRAERAERSKRSARLRKVLLRLEMFCLRQGAGWCRQPRRVLLTCQCTFGVAVPDPLAVLARPPICSGQSCGSVRFSLRCKRCSVAPLRLILGTARMRRRLRFRALALVAAPLVAPVPPLAIGAAPHPARRGRSALRSPAKSNVKSPSKKWSRAGISGSVAIVTVHPIPTL